jgi:hypothetical protein
VMLQIATGKLWSSCFYVKSPFSCQKALKTYASLLIRAEQIVGCQLLKVAL